MMDLINDVGDYNDNEKQGMTLLEKPKFSV